MGVAVTAAVLHGCRKCDMSDVLTNLTEYNSSYFRSFQLSKGDDHTNLLMVCVIQSKHPRPS